MDRVIKRRKSSLGYTLVPILLLLLLLSLGALHIASQQIELYRMNHLQDNALRMIFRLEKVLIQLSKHPSGFPMGESRWEGVQRWPMALLSVWRDHPHAMHLIDKDGSEMHVLMEAYHQPHDLFRFNAVGVHPSGASHRIQWVVKCEAKRCVTISQRVI